MDKKEMLSFEELEMAEELSKFSDFCEGLAIGLGIGAGVATIVYVAGAVITATPT